ncbi:RILP-like protein 1 isoform X2 [Gadus macrocephalus]|uniref:RILP-like protein 1 isoform X2 n=1 Tax=Gadus macrocephalus TaxID=80720 RepID=UPI0028CB3F28|nr:RILP-like protein 1 isoform X2 [Gadus macrocephalus]
MDMENFGSALDKKASEMTVVDVYDIAAVVGQEFEWMIDRYGCEALLRLMPKVVRVLELLEVLVSRSAVSPEAEELRQERDRLRRERDDRQDQERRRQQELELVEDAWRGEIQEMRTQISHLQSENHRLRTSLSIKDKPSAEQEPNEDGKSEREQQWTNKMTDIVNKQRHELCAKDHKLSKRNEEVEALQAQQLRLMRMNQDLRRRLAALEGQGKAGVQQRVELEALAQARLQELSLQQQELRALQQQLSGLEAERRGIGGPERRARAEVSPAQTTLVSTQVAVSSNKAVEAPTEPIRQPSLWVECGGDSGLLAGVFESEPLCPVYTSSSDTRPPGGEEEEVGEEEEEEKDVAACSAVSGGGEVSHGSGDESDTRFTLQELRDVLLERNELKAQVFVLEEELAYYKSEESEDEGMLFADPEPDPPCSAPAAQPDSGIRRLIFTAIMPMVAAGLIQDDPTLLPIRRLWSLV